MGTLGKTQTFINRFYLLLKKLLRGKRVEFVVFSLVSLVFLNSLMSLFLKSNAPEIASAIKDSNESRSPSASTLSPEIKALDSHTPHDLLEFNPQEKHPAKHETSLGKIRLVGKLPCDNKTKKTVPEEIRIQNTSNHFMATVFIEKGADQFSTDYLPLKEGENLITLECVLLDKRKPTSHTVLKTFQIAVRKT